MQSRILTGLLSGTVCAAGAVVIGVPAVAWADPAPAPTLPNVNAYTPVSPVDYTVMSGNWYAFSGGAGITCVLDKLNGGYGCSGPLPGAPGGANLVSGGPVGPPGFSNTSQPIFAAAGDVKPLAPNTRLSFREISCGVDAGGSVACVNSHDQVGFVISPGGTFVAGSNPLLERPEGTSPYQNALPG